MKRATNSDSVQEVSRVRSTKHRSLEKSGGRKRKLKAPFGKEQIRRKKLNPHYVVGFIDGEGALLTTTGI